MFRSIFKTVCFSLIYTIFIQYLPVQAQDTGGVFDEVIKNLKSHVSENKLEFYEKFTRKIIKDIKDETHTPDEINYFIQSITIFIEDQDKINSDLNSINEITTESRIKFKDEEKRIADFSLKDCYQFWVKNKLIYKNDILMIEKNLILFFDEHPLIILDFNANISFYDNYLPKTSLELQNKTKSIFVANLKSILIKNSQEIERNYNSLEYFGKATSILDEKANMELITFYMNDLFIKKENFIVVGDFSEIEMMVFRVFNDSFNHLVFGKTSKNFINVYLQIHFKNLMRNFKDDLNFVPIHFGNKLNLNLVRNITLEKVESTIKKTDKITWDEVHKYDASIYSAKESWYCFEKFIQKWYFHGLTHNFKYSTVEENKFVSDHFFFWFQELNPYVGHEDFKFGITKESFEVFEKYLDEILLKDKDAFIIYTKDEMVITKRKEILEALPNYIKPFEENYLKNPQNQERYLNFQQNLKAWIKIYYFDKLTPQEKKDIPLRKQFRLLVYILLDRVWDKRTTHYTYRREVFHVSDFFNKSIKTLLELELITGETIDDTKLKEKKLTEIDLALFKYINIAKVNNPVFKYFDFDNDADLYYSQYLKYEKESMPENEKVARDLLFKLINEASLIKCKADKDDMIIYKEK